jgi:glycosyltransferase involved in cell wall biosynthesis
VDGNSVVNVAAVLSRLLQDNTLGGSMGRQGYERVMREFTWEKVAKKTADLAR